MKPGKYNLLLYSGDSYHWRFQLWTDAEKTDPVDLTDATVAAQIRDRAGGTLLAEMECEVTLPNVIDAVLTSTESEGLVGTRGAWDLQITWSDTSVTTVLCGGVSIVQDVTEEEVLP